jgi:hypothetical protein
MRVFSRWAGFLGLLAILGAATAAEPLRKTCAGAILNPGMSANRKYKIEVGPAGMSLVDREIRWLEADADGSYHETHTWSNHDLVLSRPYHGYFFIPNTGKGFLLFTPYPDNPFVAFYNLKGKPLVTFAVKDLLEANEISQVNRPWGRCLAEGPCSFNDYRLAEEPKLSDDGCFVEFKTISTARRIRFFLPLGMPVTETLDKQLLSLLTRSAEEIKAGVAATDSWIKDLDQEDIEKRNQASQMLRAKADLAIDSLEKTLAHPPSAEVRGRVAGILESLPPWCRILRDPGLLSSLLSYPSAEIQRAAQATLLRQIRADDLPRDPKELKAWVARNGDRLRWDADRAVYTLQPGK